MRTRSEQRVLDHLVQTREPERPFESPVAVPRLTIVASACWPSGITRGIEVSADRLHAGIRNQRVHKQPRSYHRGYPHKTRMHRGLIMNGVGKELPNGRIAQLLSKQVSQNLQDNRDALYLILQALAPDCHLSVYMCTWTLHPFGRSRSWADIPLSRYRAGWDNQARKLHKATQIRRGFPLLVANRAYAR